MSRLKRLLGGGQNFWILNFFECISIPAVNIFILITGYFSCKSNDRKICKPLNLISQTIIWGCIYTIAYNLFIDKKIGIGLLKSIVGSIIFPNYFVTLYVVLYVISPYLNYTISSLSKKTFELLLLYLFLIFSVWATIMDLGNEILNTTSFNTGSPVGQRGSQFGYTIVHFIFIYLLGAYIRLTSYKMSIKKAIVGIFFLLILLYSWRCIDLMYCKDQALATSLSYNNPLVIGLSVLFFEVFLQLKIKSPVINELSRGAFTCYIIQGYFLKEIKISQFVNGSLIEMLFHIIISLITIYLLSYLAYKLFSVTIEKMLSKIIVQFKY